MPSIKGDNKITISPGKFIDVVIYKTENFSRKRNEIDDVIITNESFNCMPCPEIENK